MGQLARTSIAPAPHGRTRLTINLQNLEVGFIGLGNMGLPMCKRMLTAQVHVKVFDINSGAITFAVDHGARNGRLTIFVGGDKSSFDRVSPLLGNLGKAIHCGVLGSGNVVKLVTNQLWFIAAAAIGEGFATGIANGVELGKLWGAIKESVGDSFVARHDAPSIFAGHYDPSFSLELCLKDLGLISELGQQVDADLPMTAAAISAFTVARDRYGASAAELHVAKRIEDDSKISMRLDGNWTPP